MPNDGNEQPLVLVVSDPASVGDFPDDKLEDLESDIVVLQHLLLDLPATHEVIVEAELVLKIPAERAKFLSVDDDIMEKAEGEKEFFVHGGIAGFVELAIRDLLVDGLYVFLEVCVVFHDHLDARLQNVVRKEAARLGRDPQSEVFIVEELHFLNDFFQLRHELWHQMTILQQNPVPFNLDL